MTLDQINYFLEVASAGSMSKAAENLYVSQPNMSMAIKSLEQELGVQLFNRSSKGVELTHQGAEFLFYAESIISNLRLMQNIEASEKDESIEFGISTQYVSYSIIPLLDQLQQMNHRSTTITLRQKSFFDVVEDVESGLSEIGLLYVSEDQLNFINSFIKRKLIHLDLICEMSMNIALIEGHPLYTKKSVQLTDLKQYPMAFFNIADKDYLYVQIMKELEFEYFSRKLIVQDFFHLLHAMVAANAVSYIATPKNRDEVSLFHYHGFKLKLHPLKLTIPIHLCLIKRNNQPVSPIAQNFIYALRKTLEKDELVKRKLLDRRSGHKVGH